MLGFLHGGFGGCEFSLGGGDSLLARPLEQTSGLSLPPLKLDLGHAQPARCTLNISGRRLVLLEELTKSLEFNFQLFRLSFSLRQVGFHERLVMLRWTGCHLLVPGTSRFHLGASMVVIEPIAG